MRLLITGAGGGIGSALRERLPDMGHRLRLLDHTRIESPRSAEQVETVLASITSTDKLAEACRGMDAVLHLAGISTEAPWQSILHTNVHGTWCVLEAARLEGIPRVIIASSSHTIGFTPVGTTADTTERLPADAPARPDTYYGWSKAAIELLGRLYADRCGLEVICIRIGSCVEIPRNHRELATWLSFDDLARLIHACLTANRPGFRVVAGISNNSRRWWSLTEGRDLGYRPYDNAEVFAHQIIEEHDLGDQTGPLLAIAGGTYCHLGLGQWPEVVRHAIDQDSQPG